MGIIRHDEIPIRGDGAIGEFVVVAISGNDVEKKDGEILTTFSE
jgi:hypothetical protein